MPRKANFEKSNDNVKTEEELEQMEETEQEGEDVLNKKRRLSSVRQLIFLGRTEDIINIEGYDFKISSLTSRQQRDIMVEIMKSDDDSKIADMRSVVLSRAVVSVNEVLLEELYDEDDADELDAIEKKKRVLFDMQYSVVEELFAKYNQLTAAVESNEALDENLKK